MFPNESTPKRIILLVKVFSPCWFSIPIIEAAPVENNLKLCTKFLSIILVLLVKVVLLIILIPAIEVVFAVVLKFTKLNTLLFEIFWLIAPDMK